jgi:hypothetical protein
MVSLANPGRRDEHLKSPEHVQDVAGVLKDPLDLIETFGPLSGMHAAMAAHGVGMPCGIVARFEETSGDDIVAAIEKTMRLFPILDRRISWADDRPLLISTDPIHRSTKNLTTESLFDLNCTRWRYRFLQHGIHTWFTAIWPHAMADGPSMLRFIETVAGTIANQPRPRSRYRRPRQIAQQPMVEWMMRFLIDQSRRYLRLGEQRLPPGVAWCTLQREFSLQLIENSREGRSSAAAWLAAAACIALCEQKCVADGLVLLNIQVERTGLERFGGFGFAAGSLFIPVKIRRDLPLPALARSIFDRLTSMIDRGWDSNFDRFVGSSPRRHHWLARLHARGRHAPIVSVSWKGSHWELGRQDKIRNIACFALSPTLHISGHLDWTGMSLSVASRQSADSRRDLLSRIVHQACGKIPDRILAFDGCDIAD